MLNILEIASEVQAVGWIEMGGYGVRTVTDINKTDEPLIFHGWLNYTGISVIPLKVYLYVHADPGEPIITKSEFVFHLPANESYRVFIYVDSIKGNQSLGVVTIDAYWEQGPTWGFGGTMQGLYKVYKSSQEEDIPEVSATSPTNNDVQATVALILLSLLIVVYGSARRRLNKS